MKKGEPTAPSKAVIKRLFARSGNRCAFPNCTVEIAQGDALIGEMCHIKAASPNGPRYDPQQTPAGRHGYDNIILLCANHHTVIDGDEETYTVDCLVRMKTDHEGRAAPIADDLAERGARRLLIQPLKISVGESGRFVSTKGSQLYDVQRTLSLKVENTGRDKAISNCKVSLLSIDPKEYEGPWLLKEGFTLSAGEHIFVPLARYGEARDPTAYNCADSFFVILSCRSRLLPSITHEHTLTVRATGLDVPPYDVRCKLWVDEKGRLRIENLTRGV